MELEASRLEVMQAEKEVVAVRQALRSLSARASQPPPPTMEGDEAADAKKVIPTDANSLKLTVSKVRRIQYICYIQLGSILLSFTYNTV